MLLLHILSVLDLRYVSPLVALHISIKVNFLNLYTKWQIEVPKTSSLGPAKLSQEQNSTAQAGIIPWGKQGGIAARIPSVS